MQAEQVKPYDSTRPKAEQVEQMFDSIAPAYDVMNRAMTLGIDKIWRRKAVKMLAKASPRRILDVATGTGDLAIQIARTYPEASIHGVDLSEGMVKIGIDKVEKAGLTGRVTLEVADCLSLPMADDTFDCVTVAYGVRNFADLAAGYREMLRVLRPGGMLCVVELSTPVNPIVRPLYRFYTRCIIPLVGRLVSHDSRAYSYLPESIAAVAQRTDMTSLMASAGFTNCQFRPLTFGTCTIYTATKATAK
jgi:demethylmenaquinone methyltransferase/2-methoxy-6-polyprenyl-1,4-benzoquinol methylase